MQNDIILTVEMQEFLDNYPELKNFLVMLLTDQFESDIVLLEKFRELESQIANQEYGLVTARLKKAQELFEEKTGMWKKALDQIKSTKPKADE